MSIFLRKGVCLFALFSIIQYSQCYLYAYAEDLRYSSSTLFYDLGPQLDFQLDSQPLPTNIQPPASLHEKLSHIWVKVPYSDIQSPAGQNQLSLFLTNLIRNSWNSKHMKQLQEFSSEPGATLDFSKTYTPFFLKRYIEQSNIPSLSTLYIDCVYRQILEILGDPRAWTYNSVEARRSLLKRRKNEIIRAIRLIPSQTLPVLATALPRDPMSALIHAAGVVAGPYVEFFPYRNKTPNSSNIRESIGMIRATQKYGAFDHDRLISSMTGLTPADLAQLRKAERNARTKTSPEAVVFRYSLASDNSESEFSDSYRTYLNDLKKTNSNVVFGALSADTIGSTPLRLRPGTVVWHGWTFHSANILGEYNPGLINQHIIEVMTIDKLFESHFWDEFAPGAMGRTISLKQLVSKDFNPEGLSFWTPARLKELRKSLDQAYPNGWIMKGTDESSSDQVISNSTDFESMIRRLQESDFEAYRKKISTQLAGFEPDWIIYELKKHPAFQAWRLVQMLSHPDHSIVQERINILKEMRVEAIGGKVLGGKSTVYRHGSSIESMTEAEIATYPEDAKNAEKFVQDLLERLPRDLKGTPFAFDIAITHRGSSSPRSVSNRSPRNPYLFCRMIESNAGPGSGYFLGTESGVLLNQFLKDFPQAVASGEAVGSGMTGPQQLEFLRKRFQLWGINPKTRYPHLVFHPDRVESDMPKLKPDPSYFQIVSPLVDPNFSSCPRSFALLKNR